MHRCIDVKWVHRVDWRKILKVFINSMGACVLPWEFRDESKPLV